MAKVQHAPLRTPQGWDRQEQALIVQIEHLMDDIYKNIALLKEATEKLDARVTALEDE